jgi:CxxC motif-containing protein (DUF1111 family)
MKTAITHLVLGLAVFVHAASASGQSVTAEAVARHYAVIVQASYQDTFAAARIMQRAINAFVAQPTANTASAFQADIGITSSRFAQETCTARQLDCLAAPRGSKGDKPEIDDETLAAVIFNQATVAPPGARNPEC